ncbi:hypothetical protein [Ensifer oleiphilus]|uniref:hypothetical protein n=1 Tax=Ensifer oleiphilus TaxID=2742698 RepID=UPI001FEF3001|nr:hypothetical protein [Ensifer oleiphilus]
MPRTGGVYSPPAGTKGVPNTTIQSVPYNTLIDDLAADANAPRPVTAGGTGATSASGARVALGVEVGANVQAYDLGLQSIAGLTTVANQMLYTTATDAYATTALTPFARTILDDPDAAGIKATLGFAAVASSASASDLTTGTLADARLPATMAGKTFSGQITAPSLLFGGASGTNFIGAGNGDDATWTAHNIKFKGWYGLGMCDHADNVNGVYNFRTGTWEVKGGFVVNGRNVWSPWNFDPNTKANLNGAGFSGSITVPEMAVDNNNNRQIQFRTSTGSVRGMVRHDQANDSMIISMFNSSGGWYRDLVLGGPNGYLSWGGVEFRMGAARYLDNGNIYMPWAGAYLSDALNSKITAEGRSYPRRVGGVDLNFHWSGQGGQPSWLWGGNDGSNMYVYNPSNFNVNYANSAGSAGNLSNWSGWAGTWIGVSRIGGTVYQNTTGRWLPISANAGNNGIAIYYGPSAITAVYNNYAGYSGGNDFSTFGLVPPGWYYSFNATLNVFEARS